MYYFHDITHKLPRIRFRPWTGHSEMWTQTAGFTVMQISSTVTETDMNILESKLCQKAVQSLLTMYVLQGCWRQCNHWTTLFPFQGIKPLQMPDLSLRNEITQQSLRPIKFEPDFLMWLSTCRISAMTADQIS
jgi:hypothetical protein